MVKNKRIKHKKVAGLSLLEIALAIAIAGVAVSCITPIWHTISIAKKQRINEEKFHYIRLNMQAYLMRFGYLPCAAADENGIASENTFAGFVPYKTLGISKNYTIDCNGKPFTFAVNKYLTRIPGKDYMPLSRQNIAFGIGIKTRASFCRLYELTPTSGGITRMDLMCAKNEFQLLDKGENIIDKNDYFYVCPPLEFAMNSPGAWRIWHQKAVNNKDETCKVCNAVAWVLISHGPVQVKAKKQISSGKEMNVVTSATQQIFCLQPNEDDCGLFNDIVLYQTRFDMAAQCGCPCTTEPMIKETASVAERNTQPK